MRSSVKKFITDFKESKEDALESVFTNGYCYWFAFILHTLFDGEIMYHPIVNHFATEIEGVLYDITGEIDSTGFEKWEEFKTLDELETERIIRYCIRKEI